MNKNVTGEMKSIRISIYEYLCSCGFFSSVSPPTALRYMISRGSVVGFKYPIPFVNFDYRLLFFAFLTIVFGIFG